MVGKGLGGSGGGWCPGGDWGQAQVVVVTLLTARSAAAAQGVRDLTKIYLNTKILSVFLKLLVGIAHCILNDCQACQFLILVI